MVYRLTNKTIHARLFLYKGTAYSCLFPAESIYHPVAALLGKVFL